MIKALDWDSEFFGFPVGEIYLDVKPDWNEFIPAFKRAASGFKLIYFKTSEDCIVPHQVLKSINGRFINQRVLYRKRLSLTENNIPDYISEYEDKVVHNDFIELAYLSGYYSRFNVDANFPEEKFKELYETWIRKSLERSVADMVFIARRNGRVRAMITSKCNGIACNIGLVAVHRSEQGKGTGRYLIRITEEHAYDQGARTIQVPTQTNNLIACRFYENLGFSAVKITNYYHLWEK